MHHSDVQHGQAVTGQKRKIWEAVARGPHKSALSPEVLEHFAQECKENVTSGQAKIVLWDNIKDNPPPQLEILPTDQCLTCGYRTVRNCHQ
jgi:hypothetical protein